MSVSHPSTDFRAVGPYSIRCALTGATVLNLAAKYYFEVVKLGKRISEHTKSSRRVLAFSGLVWGFAVSELPSAVNLVLKLYYLGMIKGDRRSSKARTSVSTTELSEFLVLGPKSKLTMTIWGRKEARLLAVKSRICCRTL
jgi:hypothetical protein